MTFIDEIMVNFSNKTKELISFLIMKSIKIKKKKSYSSLFILLTSMLELTVVVLSGCCPALIGFTRNGNTQVY